MEQISDIIKLWINIQSKQLFATSDQIKKIHQHSSIIKVLDGLKITESSRIIERSRGYYPFRIAVYYFKDLDDKLYKDNKINTFCFFQNKMIGNMDGAQSKPDTEFSPIIHIFEDNEDIRQVFFEDAYYQYHPFASRFRAIVDSSIWNYFLIKDADLKNIIRKIHKNYDAHYYDLFIAKEYADLNARVAQNSYLYINKSLNAKGNNDLQGHAADIAPFLFHSEQIITKKRKKEYEDFKKMGVDFKDYKWRILLVDDKIDKAYLQSSDDGNVSKDMIIKDRIEYLFGKRTCDRVFLNKDKKQRYGIKNAFATINKKSPKVVILCVDTIDKAKVALEHYQFDIILLDYLLDRDNPKDETQRRHYGYELLKDLNDAIGRDCSDLSPYLHYTSGDHYIVGPSHRYFFMFISAFTTAISERLRLSGWSRSEELWHIAEGACPTNTPELFCYNLQKMMIKRLIDSGIENLDSTKILKIMTEIYCREGGESSVRKRANEKYQSILSLLYHYNRILEDTELGKDIFTINESVLMTSYLKQHQELGGLLEHLMHLVHLTAFGTARQWSEMWEEYLFFKNQFDTLFSAKDKEKLIELKNEKVKVEQALQKLYCKIEEYILDLKKNN